MLVAKLIKAYGAAFKACCIDPGTA